MEKNNRNAIIASARAAGLSQATILAMLAVADSKPMPSQETQALLTQAQKARQLGVSRFTIRKLVAEGKLTPVELLPGLLRYRRDDLI